MARSYCFVLVLYNLECLVSGDVINTMKRITKYYNHLRDLLPCNDVSVMEIAARTLVKLANLPGSKGAESFEFDIKRAFEWLSGDRHEVSKKVLTRGVFQGRIS